MKGAHGRHPQSSHPEAGDFFIPSPSACPVRQPSGQQNKRQASQRAREVIMKHVISFLSLFTLLLSIPFPLYAQKEDVTLEEVVVTATRDVEEIRKVPANVTVITKEEIEKSNARATVDLLRDEVGVVVRDYYGTGKSASGGIRALGA